jgi:hypothetical protein
VLRHAGLDVPTTSKLLLPLRNCITPVLLSSESIWLFRRMKKSKPRVFLGHISAAPRMPFSWTFYDTTSLAVRHAPAPPATTLPLPTVINAIMGRVEVGR